MKNMTRFSAVAVALAVALIASSALAQAVAPTNEEMATAQAWTARLDGVGPVRDGEPLFSFTYGGKSSNELLVQWQRKRASRAIDDRRTESVTTWSDAKTGLEVRCVSVAYRDFPVVEWTAYFKNTGQADTPIIENIQAMDLFFGSKSRGDCVLRTIRGDDYSAASFEPIVETLGKGASRRFAVRGGKPTEVVTPYFSLEWSGLGVIAVLGWPGQWAAQFDCDQSSVLRVRGGQELTRLKLHPGEEIRTPLSALLFWEGDAVRGQNLWRRWMIAHNLPRPGGKLPQPFTSICMGLQQSEASEIKGIDSYVNNGVKQDYWWLDAGWYPCNGNWPNVGTWEPDASRFPRGIKAVSDYAHSKGMRVVLWFEPERVVAGTWLAKNRPQWILGGAGGGLLNFGNPEARQWVIEHIDRFIKQQGIDLYREDLNFDPIGYWRGNDPADRQGITENFHIQGHLAFWDELRRRHPGMLIDTCAGGGRRNDLESLRRAVPLLRSDFQAPVGRNLPGMFAGNQGHTYGLAMWIPFYGSGEYYNDVYSYRSHLCPAMGVGYDPAVTPVDWRSLKKAMADWRAVADEFYGDYYPLTGYSLAEDAWMAWQFNRPEVGSGMVQAFRRKDSPYESIRLKLQGLDKAAVYAVTDLDTAETKELSGRELADKGLAIVLRKQRDSALIRYRKRI